eukprot:COSAG02_NODE_5202_length_4546_cov_1.544862_2_plen_211_part_00
MWLQLSQDLERPGCIRCVRQLRPRSEANWRPVLECFATWRATRAVVAIRRCVGTRKAAGADTTGAHCKGAPVARASLGCILPDWLRGPFDTRPVLRTTEQILSWVLNGCISATCWLWDPRSGAAFPGQPSRPQTYANKTYSAMKRAEGQQQPSAAPAKKWLFVHQPWFARIPPYPLSTQGGKELAVSGSALGNRARIPRRPPTRSPADAY